MAIHGIFFPPSSKEILGPNAGAGFTGLNIADTEKFSAVVDWKDMKALGLHLELEVDRETDAGPDNLDVAIYPIDIDGDKRFDLPVLSFTVIGLASAALTKKRVSIPPATSGRHFVIGCVATGTDDLFNVVATIRPYEEKS